MLTTTIQLHPGHAIVVTYAAVILHNMLIAKRPHEYLHAVARQTDPDDPDLVWQDEVTLDGLDRMRGKRGREEAKIVRDHLRDYYSSPNGAVDWQDRAILLRVSIKIFCSSF